MTSVNRALAVRSHADAAQAERSIFTESLADDASPSELRVAPCRLARVDQFELDWGHTKNPDHDRLLRAFLDAVVMRCVGDPSDKAPGRYRNGGVRVEIRAAVHPPRARQHKTERIGRVRVRRAHKAR